MTTATASSRNRYIMCDQVPGKIRQIMGEALPKRPRTSGWERSDDGPLLSRPGWVAITLLVIAFNLMAVLPPAA